MDEKHTLVLILSTSCVASNNVSFDPCCFFLLRLLCSWNRSCPSSVGWRTDWRTDCLTDWLSTCTWTCCWSMEFNGHAMAASPSNDIMVWAYLKTDCSDPSPRNEEGLPSPFLSPPPPFLLHPPLTSPSFALLFHTLLLSFNSFNFIYLLLEQKRR